MTDHLDDVSIRPATRDDAVAIARIHIASWRGAYVGIIPEEYLRTLDTAQREEKWRLVLAQESTTTWIAHRAHHALGFSSMGPSRDEDADLGMMEIYTLYLDPETWGLGVGRELMRTMLSSVRSGTPLSLWVPAEAGRALHFYRRHGFVADGIERVEEVGGHPVTAVRMRRPGLPN